MQDEKLQKIMANAGVASRRESEKWIQAGRVSVNGKISEIGDRALLTDKIRVDGKILRVTKPEDFQRKMIAYHKPEGEISTRKDPEGRPTIFDSLPTVRNSRWLSVGRLDFNTSGLIFFTNDGNLANKLMHPSLEIVRKYAVRVRGQVTDDILKQLQSNVDLGDGDANFDTIEDGGGEGANHWYHVTLKEGRNREVRRLWEAFDIQVSRLHRIKYGPFELPRAIKRGRYRELTPEELVEFEKLAGLQSTKVKVVRQIKSKQRQNKRLKARKVFKK
ncbi:MAG: pseudouridine synthase [Kangiellaceae bacterium]|nr:pseudouridine synthase [Kangiellaceae bacterium]